MSKVWLKGQMQPDIKFTLACNYQVHNNFIIFISCITAKKALAVNFKTVKGFNCKNTRNIIIILGCSSSIAVKCLTLKVKR